MTDINVEINVTGAPIDIGTIAVGSYSDMQKGVYDTNNSGVVDDAEKVNGLTVETAVPSGAVFTDTIYDDTPVTVHIADEANPHATTKTHVGLPLVDNTSDATKPVSTPQQTALNLKVDIADIVDDLITGGSVVPLSAEQGKNLKLELTENKYTSLDNEGQVIPLYASAIEGNLDVTLQGKTYTNIVENGDFEDGTTGWTDISGTKSIVGGRLYNDGTNASSTNAYQDVNIIENNDYLVIYEHEVLSGAVGFNFGGETTVENITGTGILVELKTATSSANGNAVYNFAANSEAYIGKTHITNLTAISETETDLDILAAKYPFVDGTKSVSPQKVSCSVGDKETHLYTTEELSGLPNGVRDERNLLSGEKVQRVFVRPLVDADFNPMTTTYANLDYAKIKRSELIGISSVGVGRGMVANYPNKTAGDYDNAAWIGHCDFNADNSNVWVGYAKGTTLEQAKTDLISESIWYELATPITTQLPPQLLKSEKSGTIYVEQKIEDFGFYGSSFIILDTDYPITALTEVVKVDTQTGEETTLDIGNCTIAGDGLNFTCTDLVSGDFVWCEFEYTPAGAPPTVDYIVSTTLKGQVNDNSDGVKYLNKKVVGLELKVDAPINTISGTFTTTDAKTVTVTNGVITNIV